MDVFHRRTYRNAAARAHMLALSPLASFGSRVYVFLRQAPHLTLTLPSDILPARAMTLIL